MIKIVKVTEKGQICIPNIFRKKIGINRGDSLIFIEVGGRMLLEKAGKISDKIHDEFKDTLKFSEQSLKEVWGNSQDDVWNQYLK